MASETMYDIANRALLKIGENVRIEGPDDKSIAARVLAQVYDDALGELLEDFPWSFAKAQATLAELAAVSRIGWEHAYQLPSDFVAPRAILAGGTRYSLIPGECRTPYELQAGDASGTGERASRIFCTDEDLGSSTLEYTTDAVAVVAFPRLFVEALVWRLAAEFALGVKHAAEQAEAILDDRGGVFVRAFAKAATADLRGRGEDPEVDPPSIRARL
jgi:hypothetical protein